MSTLLSTDLFLVDRSGVNYNITSADVKAFMGGSQFDWQTVAGNPTPGTTTRSDGTALVDGDQAWDNVNNLLYAWDAGLGAWGLVGPQFDWQSAAGDPNTLAIATRGDGTSTLVDGDQAWDSVDNVLYAWDAATSQWLVVGGWIHTTGGSSTLVNREARALTAASTATLPATPANGEEVIICTADTTSIIARNGSTIMGLAEDVTIDCITCVHLLYSSGTWRIV